MHSRRTLVTSTRRTAPGRPSLTLALASLLSLAMLLLVVGTARAAITHPLIDSFGPDGTAGTEYLDLNGRANTGLAYDQAGEHLLVAIGNVAGSEESEICRF